MGNLKNICLSFKFFRRINSVFSTILRSIWPHFSLCLKSSKLIRKIAEVIVNGRKLNRQRKSFDRKSPINDPVRFAFLCLLRALSNSGGWWLFHFWFPFFIRKLYICLLQKSLNKHTHSVQHKSWSIKLISLVCNYILLSEIHSRCIEPSLNYAEKAF